jgi:hypothetical protein
MRTLQGMHLTMHGVRGSMSILYYHYYKNEIKTNV